ncbi:TetR family transcriptional regulator [Mycobacterium sp. M26]|uniref:TetR family transcriptional regulator n=1 Tax=Mycobacterium sp. M26 TaxID=1762962 RepID=UPI00073E8806|nr:TetR family transcriptional regulator [Mycobacterium sp. M26]
MDDAGRSPARVALIDAAERLIAEQGPAVSLRQVVTAAGQRNSAAIRYHFGAREQLIAAVVEARQSIFEPKRLDRLAALEADGEADARGLLEALLAPVFEYQRAATPSYHARFMEKIRDFPGVELLGRQDWAATNLIARRLTRMAGPATDATRAIRARGLMTVVFALLADLERAQYATPDERTAAEQATLDMVLGVVNSAKAAATP